MINPFFARHERRIEKDPNSGCWLWAGSHQVPDGYGLVWWRGRYLGAHRAAYEASRGDGSTTGQVVRHSCDTPACVNPAHLLLGTNIDNMRDMVSRRRSGYGSRNVNAKLTDGVIAEIRDRHIPGDPVHGTRPIARELGVDPATVRDALLRRTWGHV